MDTIDTQIETLLQSISKSKKELENSFKETTLAWKTNCMFPLHAGISKVVNLQTASLSELQVIVNFILDFQNKAEETNKLLQISGSVNYFNYPLEDWLFDCKKRSLTLQRKDKQAALSALEKKATSLISAETRRFKELQELLDSSKDVL